MTTESADDWRRGEPVDTPPPTSPPRFELAPDDVSGTPLWPVQQIVDGAGGLSSNSVFTVSQAVWTLPSAKAEWFLQLFDDMYGSFALSPHSLNSMY